MYSILAMPVGKNSSYDKDTAENKGGIVIYLVKDAYEGSKQEVGRVAFERKNSLNPRVPFERQLEKEITKARKAVELINGLFEGAGKLA